MNKSFFFWKKVLTISLTFTFSLNFIRFDYFNQLDLLILAFQHLRFNKIFHEKIFFQSPILKIYPQVDLFNSKEIRNVKI